MVTVVTIKAFRSRLVTMIDAVDGWMLEARARQRSCDRCGNEVETGASTVGCTSRAAFVFATRTVTEWKLERRPMKCPERRPGWKLERWPKQFRGGDPGGTWSVDLCSGLRSPPERLRKTERRPKQQPSQQVATGAVIGAAIFAAMYLNFIYLL